MPSIARIVAVLLLVGGTALASPIVNRSNIPTCVYDKLNKFACSIQEAEAMRSGTMARPSWAGPDFEAFLEDCCAKNPNQDSSFHKADNTPVPFDIAQGKKPQVNEPARQHNINATPAILGLANKNEDEKVVVDVSGQRQEAPQKNEKATVDVAEPNAAASSPQTEKAQIDASGQRENTPSSVPLHPAQGNDNAEVDVNDQPKAVTPVQKSQADVNPLLPLPFDPAHGQENSKVDVTDNEAGNGQPTAVTPAQDKADVKEDGQHLPLSPTQGDDAEVDVHDNNNNQRKPVTPVQKNEGDVKPLPLPFDRTQGEDNSEVDVTDNEASNGQRTAVTLAQKSKTDVKKANGQHFPLDPAQGDNAQVDVHDNGSDQGKPVTPAEHAQINAADGQRTASPHSNPPFELDVISKMTPPPHSNSPFELDLISKMPAPNSNNVQPAKEPMQLDNSGNASRKGEVAVQENEGKEGGQAKDALKKVEDCGCNA